MTTEQNLYKRNERNDENSYKENNGVIREYHESYRTSVSVDMITKEEICFQYVNGLETRLTMRKIIKYARKFRRYSGVKYRKSNVPGTAAYRRLNAMTYGGRRRKEGGTRGNT